MVAMGKKSAIQYAVVCYLSGTEIYVGPSADAVGFYNERRTIWASGRTKAEALREARRLASHARLGEMKTRRFWVETEAPPDRPCKYDPSSEEIEQRKRQIREQGFTDHHGRFWPSWGEGRWEEEKNI